METLFEVEGIVRLESPDHVYNFMKELLSYELFITANPKEWGLDEAKDGPTFKLNRPFVEEGLSHQQMKEFAWVIGVDATMRALYIDLLSIGDITRTLVTPWLSFRGTFHYAASAIYLVHNHPSGDPTPSESDITLTKAIIEGGMKMRRPLIDHIIMGNECYHAFEYQMSVLEEEVTKELIEKKELVRMQKVLLQKQEELLQRLNDEKNESIKIQVEYEHALQDKDDMITEKDDEIAKLKKLLGHT